MNIKKSLAIARRQIHTIEGAVLYVTERGQIRKQIEKGDKIVYEIYVNNGIQYVEENGKQIIPEKEVKAEKKAKKGKGISELSADTDANTD